MFMNPMEVQDFRKKGFTEAQIEEIDAGLQDGLAVDVYAKIDLMPQQMYQLRLGLQSSLDMSPYAIPEYDWFQLEEIREGMQLGIDVKKYDSVDMSSKHMREMRKGLEVGMDLSDFLKYSPGIMREIRKSLSSRIDILNYVEDGYGADQLKEIREAVEAGIDIHQYMSPEFRAVSIHEIRLGLEENVDVEIYAKPCYNWSQMEEIRLGLMSQVDVTYYQSPLYDRLQMREIRLGLEDGLEVDEYTSLMYPASVMKKIRENLKKGGSFFEAEDNVVNSGEENRDGIMVSVSEDDMSAFIRVNADKFGIISRKEILRSLRVMGITKNIDPRMLDNLLSGKHLNEVVQIAAGKPPIDGADGFYEFFFNTEKVRAPKILEDGSVDFQNMEWYEQVKRGQKLAYYHSAGKGEDGFTVTGKRIAPKRGKEMMALRGKGFLVQPDRKTYISNFDGKVDLDGNNLEVSQILLLKEVNQVTGNVRFAGNILISGDVSDGVIIESGGDVIIDGFVGNCSIKAHNDVIMRKGVNGGGTGSIEAGGAVEAKFFESVNVRAGKSIKVNYCLNSNIYSEDCIDIFGGKGLILGGTVFAAHDIKVSNVGNELGVRTIIRMGVSDTVRNNQKKVDSELVDLENKLIILQKGQRDFQDKFPAEIRNAMEMYIKIENAIFTLNKEKSELLEEKDKIMRQIMLTADAMMTVTNNLYENILVEIDGHKIISTKARNVTVKRVDNRVGIFKNN